jgi:hypothetical protein
MSETLVLPSGAVVVPGYGGVTEKLVLRKYQVESVDRLRDGYRAGHRSQLLEPTMQVDNTVTGHNRTLRFTNIPGFDGVVVETTFTSPGGGDPARALDNVVIPFLVNQINRWPGAPKALDDMSVLDDLIAAYSDRCGTDTRGAIRDAITNLIRRA